MIRSLRARTTLGGNGVSRQQSRQRNRFARNAGANRSSGS